MSLGRTVAAGTILLGVLACGCDRPPIPRELSARELEYSDRYKADGRHADLHWLVMNCLRAGMHMEQVEQFLGPGHKPGIGDPDAARLYLSKRTKPFEHLLVIRYAGKKITSWTWKSE